MTKNESTLVLKLTQIMAETHWVEKKGRNAFFNYEYAKEADILNAVRDKLAENKIFIFTSIESTDFKESGKRTKDGSPMNLVFVKTKHTFWDAESGETAEVFGQGCGEDSGDKAVYKAITGAMKYFISKNFLISAGDDPEKDDEKEKGSGFQKVPEVKMPEAYSPTPASQSSEYQESSTAPISVPFPSPASFTYENSAKDFVKAIQSRTGPKKDGTTYTRYSIETLKNGFFTTFNSAFADLAKESKEAGQEVLIRYRANGRWKDIESIRFAEEQQATATYADTDSLPF